MMTYDNCPKCKLGEHRNCIGPEDMSIICTCPVCNSLAITEIDFDNDLSKESFLVNIENMRHHVDAMNDEEWKIFKIMVNE